MMGESVIIALLELVHGGSVWTVPAASRDLPMLEVCVTAQEMRRLVLNDVTASENRRRSSRFKANSIFSTFRVCRGLEGVAMYAASRLFCINGEILQSRRYSNNVSCWRIASANQPPWRIFNLNFSTMFFIEAAVVLSRRMAYRFPLNLHVLANVDLLQVQDLRVVRHRRIRQAFVTTGPLPSAQHGKSPLPDVGGCDH